MGAVVTNHRGRIGFAVAYVGDADLGRLVNDMVIREDLAVRGNDDPGARSFGAGVVEDHVDVDNGGIHLGCDCRNIGGTAGPFRGAPGPTRRTRRRRGSWVRWRTA